MTVSRIYILILIILLGMMVFSLKAAEKGKAASGGGNYNNNTQNMSKPLEVRGQTRNLSMILTISSKKDKIKIL